VSIRVGDYTSALDSPSGSVDLVVSALSIHPLDDADKRALFRRIFGWLKPGAHAPERPRRQHSAKEANCRPAPWSGT